MASILTQALFKLDLEVYHQILKKMKPFQIGGI